MKRENEILFGAFGLCYKQARVLDLKMNPIFRRFLYSNKMKLNFKSKGERIHFLEIMKTV